MRDKKMLEKGEGGRRGSANRREKMKQNRTEERRKRNRICENKCHRKTTENVVIRRPFAFFLCLIRRSSQADLSDQRSSLVFLWSRFTYFFET